MSKEKLFDIIGVGGTIRNITSSEELKRSILEEGSASIYGFDTIEVAEEFIKNFPKYVKLKVTCIGWSGYKDKLIDPGYRYKIVREDRDGWVDTETPIITFRITGLNQITGELNEQGMKRVNKFVDVLTDLGYLVT